MKSFTTPELISFIEAYTDSFNEVFSTKLLSKDFITKYESGLNGYSIHSIAFDDKKIIGGFTVIPQNYFYSKPITLGMACDSFVLKEYRSDELLLYKLFKASISKLELEGVSSIISIPNPTAVKYWKMIAKWITIDYLIIQLIPLNYKGLYPIYFLYLLLINFIGIIFKKNSLKKPKTKLINDLRFLKSRFPKENYTKTNQVYIRPYDESGLKAIYVFNHFKLNFVDFTKSCLKIMKENRDKEKIYSERTNSSTENPRKIIIIETPKIMTE